MEPHHLIAAKIRQAKGILDELDIDCWLTFVRESGLGGDPVLEFLLPSDVTWHTALLITRRDGAHAIVGRYDRKTVEETGAYDGIVDYVTGVKEPLLDRLRRIAPRQIAINYSRDSEICDGLTHGLFLTLSEILDEIGWGDRLISAERVVSALRQRKIESELERIRRAIDITEAIFTAVASFIRPGRTEAEIAGFMVREMERAGVEPAWEPSQCPAVFTGPETAGAHYRPTDRPVEPGHLLNMDFGVRVEGYCSDLQRTFYVLRAGESQAPEAVRHGFETIVESIERARTRLRPGVPGWQVDEAAREHVVERGYEAFPHGLGHQVGRSAHDGTALLGPAWEKYASKPFEAVEEGMVFTLEPRLTVPGHGVVTIENMVQVTADGARYLSTPQTELLLVGRPDDVGPAGR